MRTASAVTAVLVGVCSAVLAPACGDEEKPMPTPTVTPARTTATPESTPGATPVSTTIPATYEVQPGDTLSEIADRFGTDVETLAAANDIGDPDLIYPGQVLVIPAQSP